MNNYEINIKFTLKQNWSLIPKYLQVCIYSNLKLRIITNLSNINNN